MDVQLPVFFTLVLEVWLASCTICLTYGKERCWYHWVGGRVAPRDGLDVVEKC